MRASSSSTSPGDLRGDAREDLEAAYADAAAREPQVVVLNLTGRRLHGLHRHRPAREPAGPRPSGRPRGLSAYGLTDHYREIFAITRLSEYIHVYDDEPSALGNVPAGT